MIAIILFIACSQQHNSIDDRAKWELYEPTFVKSPPIGRPLTWSAPDSIVTALQNSGEDWNQHLSCGLKLSHVDDHADVRFECGHLDKTPGFHSEIIQVRDKNVVVIDDDYCDDLPSVVTLHAWGHQLGFDENIRWYPTVTAPDKVNLVEWGYTPNSWGLIESDGLRIWAHKNGAPGCGDDELPWSWESNPDLYKSYPTPDQIRNFF